MSNPHEITLAEAITMTQAYQNDPFFSLQTLSAKIPADAYLDIINQTGCEEVRTYFAKNDLGDLTLVVVGVDEYGNDMTNGKIMNKFTRCPDDCPQNSPLM
jgi:hypothetical protein